jgi:2-dehydro-3-deoxyphosphogluconate aldolase/(4S)-4-hydroxy-2-oxoglutarate aldolase
VPVIELTLRTPGCAGAIARIVAQVPDVLVGAGTIVDASQPQRALDAGVQFLVSPGGTADLRHAMRDSGLPHLPGGDGVRDFMASAEGGYSEMKFFPAEAAGGAGYLKALHSPIPAMRLCPTGGVAAANAATYPALPVGSFSRRGHEQYGEKQCQ